MIVLLTAWQTPPLVVVAVSALGGIVLSRLRVWMEKSAHLATCVAPHQDKDAG